MRYFSCLLSILFFISCNPKPEQSDASVIRTTVKDPDNIEKEKAELIQELIKNKRQWMLYTIKPSLGTACKDGGELLSFRQDSMTYEVCKNERWVKEKNTWSLAENGGDWELKFGNKEFDLSFSGDTLILKSFGTQKADGMIKRKFISN